MLVQNTLVSLLDELQEWGRSSEDEHDGLVIMSYDSQTAAGVKMQRVASDVVSLVELKNTSEHSRKYEFLATIAIWIICYFIIYAIV